MKLRYHNEFYVRAGSVLSLSAQKVRVTRPNQLRVYRNEEELDNGRDGVVHVVIRVNAAILQETRRVPTITAGVSLTRRGLAAHTLLRTAKLSPSIWSLAETGDCDAETRRAPP